MEFLKTNITEEWWDLVNDFPEFTLELSPSVIDWRNHLTTNIPKVEDICNLRYGFECDIGWKTIIRTYFEKLRMLIETAKNNGDEIIYKTCIFKEKFGELRDQGDFYGKNYKEYWDDYLNLSRILQDISAHTCEQCGEVGRTMRRGGGFGWLKTLCDEHHKEWVSNRYS